MNNIMKLCLFLVSLLFASCYSIPVVSQAPTLSGKKVEKFVDDIAKSLTLEHQNALKLVASQNETVLSKKKKLDGLTLEFRSLGLRLNNITNTYNALNRERLDASRDYEKFMRNFKRIESLIKAGKIDYEQEMKFLRDIKNYIRKVSLKCKV
jgi:formylmethanofuran dehydrogenase subunit A